MYRRVFSSTAFSSSRGRALGILTATSVGAVTLYSAKSRPIHNDSGTVSLEPSVQNRSGALQTLVWGSNKNGTLLLEAKATSVTTPTPVPWLVNVALRDLRTQASFSACVDARGDVYQWARDVSEGGSPRLVLEGKDIVQLQLTRSKVFALSSSGVIYAISSDPSRQAVHEQPSGSWFGWLGLTPQSCDYVELSPNSTMSWREKVTSISAGDEHLLALTSLGRAFAHPITKSANVYGQLGIRNIEVQNKGTSSPVSTELIPKSVSDPNSKTTAFIRPSEWSEPECFAGVDDTSIRFCTKLFEIPSLSGIQFAQLSAGARTSFARTKDGKVLGWGANQYGQIGLGGNIAVDAVTVPTEVILWRNVSKDVQTKCINVSAGGDLTSFTAERSSSTTRTADVLMCGNGQWGGLGNNQFSNFMSNPVRVRTVSGLTEYNESTKKMEAILPQAISVSPTGHVLLALGTPEGRDLFLWGRNHDSELGNGKKSSIPLPAVLNVGENERLMLYRRKADVYDLGQKVWKRNVTVEQRVVAGHNNSVIYWQVI